MSTPTVAQVGGTHYQTKTGVGHWDLCEDHDIGYLEGNASKYFQRWRSKGKPAEDLEKGISYLEKMGSRGARRTVPVVELIPWLEANVPEADDRRLIFLTIGHGSPGAIADALSLARSMLREWRRQHG